MEKEEFADNQGLVKCFETSAKTGIMLDEAFEVIIKKVLKSQKEKEKSPEKSHWDVFDTFG